ncbi:MAG: GNAT family N-acetyltransferase [Acidobacteriota bacterium]
MSERLPIVVRNTRPEDFSDIIALTKRVYPSSLPWSETQLASHVQVFPEGQLVAVNQVTGKLVGMAASLIILWNDYDLKGNWREFTAGGMFTNHDPAAGRTLYGAEVMVDPDERRRGIGKRLYEARRELARRFGLLRIRAGARLRGYHRYAKRMKAEEYVIKLVRHQLRDATLSFQLSQGFHVLAVVPDYLGHDPESLGFAAVIEWLNPEVAGPEDYAKHNSRVLR